MFGIFILRPSYILYYDCRNNPFHNCLYKLGQSGFRGDRCNPGPSFAVLRNSRWCTDASWWTGRRRGPLKSWVTVSNRLWLYRWSVATLNSVMALMKLNEPNKYCLNIDRFEGLVHHWAVQMIRGKSSGTLC